MQMPEVDEFLHVQTTHRLGSFGSSRPSLSDAARNHAIAVGSGGTLAWNAAMQAPFAVNGWETEQETARIINKNRWVKGYKFLGTLQSMLAAGLDFDAVIDMQDRRIRALHTPECEIFPTICFNRAGSAQGRVLWHMPGPLHQIGSEQFLGPFPDADALPFAARAPKLVWRGGMTGRAGGGKDLRLEGYRFDKIFAEVERGNHDMAWAAERLAEFPRYHIVAALKDKPWADLGFVEQPHLHPMSRDLMQPLLRPVMAQREQARHKYIAVLRGADLASSFYWTMNSGSLGLVMDSPWESFGSAHFKPWQHYVPFREDLSDLEERLNWCESHPAECEAMVQAATAICQLLARDDLRAEADRRVIGMLGQAIYKS